eukprot:117239_1
MGNESSKHKDEQDSQRELQTFQKLISMGFNEHLSWDVAKKYKGNIMKAIDYLTKQNESQNKLQNETEFDETKYYAEFDKHVAKTEIQYNANEEEQTPQNTAKQIISIYKKLLKAVSNNVNTDQNNTYALFNEYYQIKFQLMNEQNHELLYEIYTYFKQYINAPICDATKCKQIVNEFK